MTGGRVLDLLMAAGCEVVAVDRRGTQGPLPPGLVEVIAELASNDWTRWAQGCDAAILLGDEPAAARGVLAACAAHKIPRLVVTSTLGARRDSTGADQRAASEREDAVRRASLAWTVLRLAPVFGPGDRFVTPLVAALRRRAPLILPGGAGFRLQPVALEEVARTLVAALDAPETEGETLDLVGPEIITLETVIRRTAADLGVRAWMLALPPGIGDPLLSLQERFGAPAFTRARLAALRACGPGDAARSALALPPAKVAYRGPTWLHPAPPETPAPAEP